MLPPIIDCPPFQLKPLQIKDEDAFVETMLDPLTVQFMSDGIEDEKAERALFKKIFTIYQKEESTRWFWIWGIYRDNEYWGHFELKSTKNCKEDELEVVYAIHPEKRRKGTLKTVLRYLLEMQTEWNRKVIATVGDDNEFSQGLLHSVGFRKQEKIPCDDSSSGFYWKYATDSVKGNP